MRLREYGTTGPHVLVLHGGPAAVGDVSTLAEGLSDQFRVAEPWQRASGKQPLTVARHIEDLNDLIAERYRGARPALLGHSWVAMLALCYAADHPDKTGPIALVGCATFDAASRNRLREVIENRTTERLRQELAHADASASDPADRFIKRYKLMRDLYVYDLAEPSALLLRSLVLPHIRRRGSVDDVPRSNPRSSN